MTNKRCTHKRAHKCCRKRYKKSRTHKRRHKCCHKRRRSTKGSRSKTHPGRKDYTTKRGDKVYHRRHHYVRRRRRPYTHHRRGGGPYDDTPVSEGEHKLVMEENYETLLRYYGAHAKGHSRDPFGPNAANAKSAIRATLENYQCKIPELQASLERKYGVRPALINDKYKCGQGGGRRRAAALCAARGW